MTRTAENSRPWARPRSAVSLLGAAVLVLASAAPAAAHVTISASTTAAGSYAVLEVSVPHGCDGSPTTEVTIRVPSEIHAVTPSRNALWEVEKEVVALDPPITDGHGNQVVERVASVTYRTDRPLPEGYRDSFELSVRLPETPGAALVFPTIQTCEQGEAAWIEVPGDGQSAEDLAMPAPTVVVTAPDPGVEEGHLEESAGPTATLSVASTDGAGAEDEPADADLLSVAAIVAGLLGALLGVLALVSQRRRA